MIRKILSGKYYAVVFFIFLLLSSGFASAKSETVQNFVIFGVHWVVPDADLYLPAAKSAKQESFTLRLQLPDLTPATAKQIADNQTPETDAPILTATIADAPNARVGQALLDHYLPKTRKCKTCIGDSSIGGLSYSNYYADPLPYKKNGPPFDLYVNQTKGGPFVALCFFGANTGRPKYCEVKEKIGGGLVLTYRFPQEFLSTVFQIDARLKVLLASLRLPHLTLAADTIEMAKGQHGCWTPVPGTSGAKIVNLKIGPKVWHIPRAYGSFGADNTGRADSPGLMMWLKLPNLQPLNQDDLSPLEVKGPSRYIDIDISYANNVEKYTPDLSRDREGYSMFRFYKYRLEDSKILPYQIFVTSQRNIWFETELFFSPSKNRSAFTFPPSYFMCGPFKPGLNSICNFRVLSKIRNTYSKSGEGYMILYSFSGDYFSEIPRINYCLGRLYNMFTN